MTEWLNASNENRTSFPSPARAWTTVLVLSFTYMFSFLDRQILVLLIEPIKTDLQISDTQVSLLTGLAFAVIYSLMGVPMGRAADLWVRKYVVIFGVAVWSMLTVFAGFARTFNQLFFARMGVGFGEAALTPSAYSMVADLFRPDRLARGMSVFVLGGIAAGGAMSLLLGGVVIGMVEEMGGVSLPLIGEVKPWQLVLIIAGILSLLMVIPLSLIKEPKRQGVAARRDGTNENLSFKAVLIYLWDHKSFYGPYLIGIALANVVVYGTAAWIPSYFIRVHGWGASTTGIYLGALYLIPGLAGGLAAGWYSDHLFGKGLHGAPLYIMVTVISCAVLLVPLFIYWPELKIQLLFLVLTNLVVTMFFVLFPTVVQLATPNRIRAQVSAIHLLVSNLLGIGFGPTAIALITDYGFGDDLAVGHSIAIVAVVGYGLALIILLFALKPFAAQVIAVAGESEVDV